MKKADDTMIPNRSSTHFYDEDEDDDDEEDDLEELQFLQPSARQELRRADRLSVRLLAIPDEDEDEHDRVLRKSLRLLDNDLNGSSGLYDDESNGAVMRQNSGDINLKGGLVRRSSRASLRLSARPGEDGKTAGQRVCTMVAVAVAAVVLLLGIAGFIGVTVVGPPNQPVGPYQLVERQEGNDFFQFYDFYEGRDSAGSNGFLNYVSYDKATLREIVNVTYEDDVLDIYAQQRSTPEVGSNEAQTKQEPFIYMGSAPTPAGPRDSIRLEGNRRFNRGLFIIDIRHMPVGCGVWPAFWLTDEANWPVNGEIDIVEGVNYQSVAKTALHTTKTCIMDDIPLGTMTGGWDSAQGIPNAKTGIPDMTMREARNCFVYDPHQWLNQGCVAVDTEGGSLGVPLNAKGGGVFALEWDPINRHIRTWVFSPHLNVPDNLVDSIRTASLPDSERIVPDPDVWPLPYGFFAIGEGTNCPAYHFRHMRLVFNTAFCGSVAGNRFHIDCKKQVAANFSTCTDWIKSEPEELQEAYWKIRGVYVYERAWERTWSV